MLRRLAVPLLSGFTLLGLGMVFTVSAQNSETVTHPGDPVSDDDRVFLSLAGSDDATRGITRTGNIRCWATRSAPMWAEGFTDVAVGDAHSCGLKLDKTVQCWGLNTVGADQMTVPTESGGSAILFKSIEAGDRYTCGIRDDDDGLVCWGYDRDGQASGNPSGTVVSCDYSNDSFTKISPALLHTCGLIALDEGETGSNVRCWGNDGQGKSTVLAVYSANRFKAVPTALFVTCGIIDGG